MTQATGQPKFPLFAESDTKFFLKVVDAEVEFFKNEKGEVTYLMLHQNGRDTKAVKKSEFSPGYYLKQGVNQYSKGNYDQAIQDFNEAIRLDPKTPRALVGLLGAKTEIPVRNTSAITIEEVARYVPLYRR
jgi:tetratricopeptide (TPR) repeat protein